MSRKLWSGALVAIALSAGGAGYAQPKAPEIWSSQKVLTAIATPMGALYQALAEDAALPKATSDRERLERLGKIDQSWRYYMGKLDFTGLTPQETKAVYEVIAARTEPVDRANLSAMMAMKPHGGWFTASAYGEEASAAAFHILQHGDDATRLRVLPDVATAAEKGEVDGPDFASLYDLVQVGLGRTQRYGTRFRCLDHRVVPYPLEDETKVEALRAALKLDTTFAEERRRSAENRRC